MKQKAILRLKNAQNDVFFALTALPRLATPANLITPVEDDTLEFDNSAHVQTYVVQAVNGSTIINLGTYIPYNATQEGTAVTILAAPAHQSGTEVVIE